MCWYLLDITEYDETCAFLVYIFSSLKIPTADRNRIISAFGKFGGSTPVDYNSLYKSVLKKSCIPLFLRKFVICYRCRREYDTTKQFCPWCLQQGKIIPLYKSCPCLKCPCHYSDREFDSITVDRAKSMECSHTRPQFKEYHYYIPPVGIIADIIHNNAWNSFMGLTDESIMNIANYCYVTGGHSIFSSLNMADICDRYRFAKASKAIKRLYNYSTFHIQSTENMKRLSKKYLESKTGFDLVHGIHHIFS